MKKTLILPWLLALAAAGCARTETDIDIRPAIPSREAPRTERVRVGFSSAPSDAPDTKSVVTVDVEEFTDAFLFAFWASGADEGAPCMVDGSPVAVYTDSKTFDWVLPVGESIEVMAVVNAVEDVRRDLDRWAAGQESFSRDDLLSLSYSCGSARDLRDLQSREYNMPMSGRLTVTLDPESPTLTVPVKRLFAKFNITLDVSGWEDKGWTVTAARVQGARSNTEVPYFYTGEGPGFRQTDPAKFSSVDESTAADLEELNFRSPGGVSHPVTYYFLENCQGIGESARSWSSVALDLGERVSNCSFLRVFVRAERPGSGERTFGYRIYLDSTEGSTMRSTFNIVRNTFRSIILRLGAPQDGFEWTNANVISAQPGETVTIPFETSLSAVDGELTFSSGDDARLVYLGCTMQEEGTNLDRELGSGASMRKTDFPNYGTASFRVAAGAADGVSRVRGGDSAGEISDETDVHVVTPLVLTATAASRRIQFERFGVTCVLSQADHISLLKHIDPSRDWDALAAANRNVLYTAANIKLITDNIGLREAAGSGTAHFDGVRDMGVSARPNPVANPTTLRLTFTLLNTETRSVPEFVEIYNRLLGNAYSEALDVTSSGNLVFEPVTEGGAPYEGNGYTGEVISSGCPSYSIDPEGATGYVYLKPMGYNPGSGVRTTATVLSSDLGEYELTVENDDWYIDYGERGYHPDYDDPLDIDSNGVGTEWFVSGSNLSHVRWEYALCSYSGIVFSDWATRYGTFRAVLRKSGDRARRQEVSRSDIDVYLVNPRSEWFDLEHFSWQDIDNWYYLTVEGSSSSSYATLRFGEEQGDFDFPTGGPMPEILSVGNVTTGVSGDPAVKWYGDLSGERDIEGLSIADDLRNYGWITIGKRFRLGGDPANSIEAVWAKVKVTREFVIYAGYQFDQKKYITSASTPTADGNLSRFIPYLYAPDISYTGTSLSDMVVTTATERTGIDAVNPSEEFYRATCASEHWWHGGSNYMTGATDHSGGKLWDCENADNDRACLLQNKVVVYPSPRTVSPRGELSFYELRYAGPQVSSHISFYMGHHGHHSDDIYSFRSVAYWNEPAFEFSTAGIPSGLSPSIKTSGSEKYLQLGEFTKVRFFWRKKGKLSLADSGINPYDTRWPMKNSFYCYVWTSTLKTVGYFGDQTASLSASFSTPYFDPRRSTLEKLKLFYVSIPFYRKLGSGTIKAADGGSTSGSYTEEDIVSAHDFGHALGMTDSFWVPGNQID